jgi:hypothetical protein
MIDVLTFAAAIGAGLVAGIFFAFSSFVMRALARIAPPQGIAAMQSINVAVINPVFMAVFLGTRGRCAPPSPSSRCSGGASPARRCGSPAAASISSARCS